MKFNRENTYRAWLSRQPIFKFDDQVPYKPFNQRVVGLGCEKS
jgi:hypothetical protein